MIYLQNHQARLNGNKPLKNHELTLIISNFKYHLTPKDQSLDSCTSVVKTSFTKRQAF